ncbi:unnamed protein product [Peronospora effusa]|nr:unnamed protein product [Peronospora effusa]
MIRAKFAVNSMKHMWTYDQEKESIVSLLRTTTMKLLHPNLLQNYGRQVPFNSEFVYVMPLNRLRQEVVVLHSGGQLRHHLLDDVPTQREKSGRASSGVFDRPKAVGNCDLMARAAFEGKGRREKA